MKQRTLIIFDWDDTLLPTTWLSSLALLDMTTKPTKEVSVILADIAESVLAVLRRAQMHGLVIIVTNSAPGWVELSCNRFLRSCQNLIDTIPIVSARSYSLYTASPEEWKTRAFKAEQGSANNIVSIGDSEYERQAVATLVREGCTVKSLKLEDKPSPGKIKSQLIMLIKILEGIVLQTANMDIVCSSTENPPLE
jgi:hypothetical protein